VSLQIIHNRFNQLRNTHKRSSTNAFVRDLTEPPLDHIQPGTRRRRKVKMEPRMALKPRRHSGMLVRPVIVDDQMKSQLLRGLCVDLLEETDELLMTMSGHTIPDHSAVQHAQRGKQSRRPISLIIVGHRPTMAFPQRQTRLRPVQRLDLALFVHTQDQRLIRGVQVKPHHVLQLLDELLVPAELEGFEQMRLDLVLSPDSMNARCAHVLSLCHGPGTPMRGSCRSTLQRRLDHRPDLSGRDARSAAWTRSVLLQSPQPQGQKPLTPELNGRPRHVQALCNILAENTVGGHEDNSGSHHLPVGKVASPCPFVQRRSFVWAQHNRLGCFAHA